MQCKFLIYGIIFVFTNSNKYNKLLDYEKFDFNAAFDV